MIKVTKSLTLMSFRRVSLAENQCQIEVSISYRSKYEIKGYLHTVSSRAVDFATNAITAKHVVICRCCILDKPSHDPAWLDNDLLDCWGRCVNRHAIGAHGVRRLQGPVVRHHCDVVFTLPWGGPHPMLGVCLSQLRNLEINEVLIKRLSVSKSNLSYMYIKSILRFFYLSKTIKL